tara:strand:- start:11957 stop:12787 length:831 start_codon:yes stop_codon:yes gene_type:complete
MHIITNIFGRDDWLEVQAQHLQKYTDARAYTVHCFLDKNLNKSDEDISNLDKYYPNYRFYRAIDGEHYDQVNKAVETISSQLTDDDIIVFLDCDAFPCDKNWQNAVKENLATHDITAVVMRENYHHSHDYHEIPHLCFFATTKKTWQLNNLAWTIHSHPHLSHHPYQNPQRGMLDRINAANLTLKELNRTNEFDAHRVCFGIYGDIVYHHACGIRGFEGSVTEGADIWLRKKKYGLEFTADSDMARVNAEIWLSIWRAIKEDKSYTFVRRYFMGRN